MSTKKTYYGVLVTVGPGGGAIVRRFHTLATEEDWRKETAEEDYVPLLMLRMGLTPDKVGDLGPDVPCAKVLHFNTEREAKASYDELCVRFGATIRDDELVRGKWGQG